jgi:CRISPR-associated endonuclease/helicase Cas3
VFWLDLDLGADKSPVEHWARPYSRAEVVAARQKLAELGDAGLASLSTIKQAIDTESDGKQATHLFPYEPRFVPRDKDLFDLFDTTSDLTGADVDVSRFIRDGEELDVQVFWRGPEDDPFFTKQNEKDLKRPLKKLRPQRRELCPVPFQRFREELPVLRKAGRIWRRNYRKGW